MQTITLAEVKQKAREYYAAGKLTAQHPDPKERECVNQGADGHRCAVAACFTDETLIRNPTGTVCGLYHSRALYIASDDEREAISDIQMHHDNWASTSQMYGVHDPRTIEYRNEFLKLIEA